MERARLKPVLKMAAQNDLLGGPILKWLAYADARTANAHDYSGDKAAATLTIVPEFLADAQAVFRQLSKGEII